MNAFEKFLLAAAKALVVAAPGLAPIFIHSQRGALIFNVSDAFAQAAIEQLPSPAPKV